MNPEPGVFRDMAKGTGSNIKNSRPGAGKGPSSEDGPEGVLSIVAVHISRNLIGPSISPAGPC